MNALSQLLTPEQWTAFASGGAFVAIVGTALHVLLVGKLKLAHARELLAKAQAYAQAILIAKREAYRIGRQKGYEQGVGYMHERTEEESEATGSVGIGSRV